jgi:hypothetical protein
MNWYILGAFLLGIPPGLWLGFILGQHDENRPLQ